MQFYCHEVVQRWISSDGKVADMALLRGFTFCYCDVWALGSDMEIRPHNSLYDEVVARSCAYPKMRILPQLRRNGFKGDFHGISPVRLFKALLSDPRIETLMKGGEIEVMKHFLFNARTADECWASYLIYARQHQALQGRWRDRHGNNPECMKSGKSDEAANFIGFSEIIIEYFNFEMFFVRMLVA